MVLVLGASIFAAAGVDNVRLVNAVKNHDLATLRTLLKQHADPNAPDIDGTTPLIWAAHNGDSETGKLLISAGANVKATNRYGVTALVEAATLCDVAMMEALLKAGADPNTAYGAGETPLMLAARTGNLNAVKLLIDRGANVNDMAADGTSALSMAVANAYFELASILLDLGADPNAPDPRGSPLHTLAWLRKPGSDGARANGNTSRGTPIPAGNVTSLDLAKALLKHGANPNFRIDWTETRFSKEGGTARNPPNINLGRHLLSYIGATPFYVAAKNGDAAYMRVLADGGADPRLPTQAGITPLMVACGLDYWQGESPGPFTGVTEAERLEAVKLAIELGNDINGHADFGDYPMVGDTQYTLLYYPLNVDDLLDKGVGDPRWSGSTALIGAVVSGQPSIVQFLVDHGAEIDAKTKLGWTPLMVAEGVFFANAKKEFPEAAAILKKALAQRGTEK